jgi:DnaJ like chaperone protein
MPLNTLDDALSTRRRSGSTGFWAGLLNKLGIGVPQRRLPHDSVAFTSAFVALGAKMAMADGVAVKVEAAAFAKFLEVQPGQEPDIQRLYELARQDVSGFEHYAARINFLLADEPGMKRDVLECLLYVACADGMLHPAEDNFLKTVAHEFGFSELEFLAIRALFVHDAGSPYSILGIKPDASDLELKSHYRKLVTEHHPDKLVAAGALPAVVKAATAKLATINAAYEAIQKERASRMAQTVDAT